MTDHVKKKVPQQFRPRLQLSFKLPLVICHTPLKVTPNLVVSRKKWISVSKLRQSSNSQFVGKIVAYF